MNDNFDFCLDGKTALITGGASGIGTAIAQAFDKKGVKIALVDLNQEVVVAKVKTLNQVYAYTCDIADKVQVDLMVREVKKNFRKIDILVNCAGIVELACAEEISYDAWKRTIDINFNRKFFSQSSGWKTHD